MPHWSDSKDDLDVFRAGADAVQQAIDLNPETCRGIIHLEVDDQGNPTGVVDVEVPVGGALDRNGTILPTSKPGDTSTWYHDVVIVGGDWTSFADKQPCTFYLLGRGNNRQLPFLVTDLSSSPAPTPGGGGWTIFGHDPTRAFCSDASDQDVLFVNQKSGLPVAPLAIFPSKSVAFTPSLGPISDFFVQLDDNGDPQVVVFQGDLITMGVDGSSALQVSQPSLLQMTQIVPDWAYMLSAGSYNQMTGTGSGATVQKWSLNLKQPPGNPPPPPTINTTPAWSAALATNVEGAVLGDTVLDADNGLVWMLTLQVTGSGGGGGLG